MMKKKRIPATQRVNIMGYNRYMNPHFDISKPHLPIIHKIIRNDQLRLWFHDVAARILPNNADTDFYTCIDPVHPFKKDMSIPAILEVAYLYNIPAFDVFAPRTFTFSIN